MRTKREILRLYLVHSMSYRVIGRMFDISHNTVGDLIRAAKRVELKWEEIQTLDDTELANRLYPSQSTQRNIAIPMPDYVGVHQEMQQRNMTLALLWEEYRLKTQNGYGYSQFCHYYRQHLRTLSISMRQVHCAGEKMFVDYSGKRPVLTDPATGEKKAVELFVSVLGASNFTYCEATLSQSIPDWLASNRRALRYFGGVPEIIVPDNLKSAVTKPDRYEPEIQIHYQQFAAHYATAIVPARVRRPKDKPKVEGAVLLVQRWILLRLRHLIFFTLADLNRAIHALLEDFNNRPFKKLPGCRRSRYEEIDRPALKPLPMQDYEYAKIKRVLVGPDYHIEHLRHFYSVPYTLIRRQIELRITADTIEILFKGKRVASHMLSNVPEGKTTSIEHMPPSHIHYQSWTSDSVSEWGRRVGEGAAAFIHYQLVERGQPHVGLRTCVGLIHLNKKFSLERIERACQRAKAINAMTLKSVKSILQSGTDTRPLPVPDVGVVNSAALRHVNVRGPTYYN